MVSNSRFQYLFISIHSLFAEETESEDYDSHKNLISIHSLFAEGDHWVRSSLDEKRYFNPLLLAGRLIRYKIDVFEELFQSTPSSQRETIRTCILRLLQAISIHSLLAERIRTCILRLLQAISIHSSSQRTTHSDIRHVT